jgi:thiamine phosphate synthase YjbQ (UPF0047 family)
MREIITIATQQREMLVAIAGNVKRIVSASGVMNDN